MVWKIRKMSPIFTKIDKSAHVEDPGLTSSFGGGCRNLFKCSKLKTILPGQDFLNWGFPSALIQCGIRGLGLGANRKTSKGYTTRQIIIVGTHVCMNGKNPCEQTLCELERDQNESWRGLYWCFSQFHGRINLESRIGNGESLFEFSIMLFF